MGQSYLEKLVSTNCKWKVLKRKKPPKWWLISSYKNVLQVWSVGLFTDAKVLEDVLECLLGGYFAAYDFGEVVEAVAEVLRYEVGGKAVGEALAHAADGVEGEGEGFVVADVGDDDVGRRYFGQSGGFHEHLAQAVDVGALLGRY